MGGNVLAVGRERSSLGSFAVLMMTAETCKGNGKGKGG